MTNEQIIFNAQMNLMESGIIGTTGRMVETETPDGTKKQVPEPEPIHTYAGWKERGYLVRRGEHAIAKFVIWKHTTATQKAKDSEEKEETEEVMFQKLSYFFKPSQVEPIAK